MTQHIRRTGNRVPVVLLATFLGFIAATPAARSEAALDLSDYAGKVVVVDFWASWCAPCRRSFPWLDAMQAKYGDEGLVVIGVNVDRNAEDARAFLDDVPVSFRIVGDPDGDLAREFDLIAMPSSYVIGRDGQIVANHLGFRVREQDEYESVLRETLAAD